MKNQQHSIQTTTDLKNSLKVFNSLTARHARERKYKETDQPSCTVPDQTMSLRTLLDRYSRGLPIGGIKGAPLYDDQEIAYGINLKTLDLIDLQNLAEKTKSSIANYFEGGKRAAALKNAESLEKDRKQAIKDAIIEHDKDKH